MIPATSPSCRMVPIRRRVVLAAALLGLAVVLPMSAGAAASRVELELWWDLDPIVQEGVDRPAGPVAPEEAVRRMLAEARAIVSGMIYGYSFRYTPSDETRQVAELFELTPRAQIPWGDPALSVVGTRLDDRRLRALFRYELSPEQESWRQAWQSAVIARAAGTGTGNVFLGYGERATALTNAMRESIREYLRPRVLNKPREVRGDLLLWNAPATHIAEGEYHTRVATRLRIAGITPYRVY